MIYCHYGVSLYGNVFFFYDDEFNLNKSRKRKNEKKKKIKSKVLLTNHIIRLCLEGNGNKGIPRLNYEKKKGKNIKLLRNTYQSYVLVPVINCKICDLEKFTDKYTVHS